MVRLQRPGRRCWSQLPKNLFDNVQVANTGYTREEHSGLSQCGVSILPSTLLLPAALAASTSLTCCSSEKSASLIESNQCDGGHGPGILT